MISAILGKKIGMTQIFHEGDCVPVTIVQVGPCNILQIKTTKTDGYNALQLGFEDKKDKHSTKAEKGHAKAEKNTDKESENTAKKFIKEIAWDGEGDFKVGNELKIDDIDHFKIVDVTGISKGKGFQGCVKRYGFKGSSASHGQSSRLRSRGSIGSSATPARVFKGMKMPGQMGDKKCTARNLAVADIDKEKGLIAIKGGIPGSDNGYVIIKISLNQKSKSN